MRIRPVSVEEMYRLQDGSGGANDLMSTMLGKTGVVASLTSDNTCQVY